MSSKGNSKMMIATMLAMAISQGFESEGFESEGSIIQSEKRYKCKVCGEPTDYNSKICSKSCLDKFNSNKEFYNGKMYS